MHALMGQRIEDSRGYLRIFAVMRPNIRCFDCLRCRTHAHIQTHNAKPSGCVSPPLQAKLVCTVSAHSQHRILGILGLIRSYLL